MKALKTIKNAVFAALLVAPFAAMAATVNTKPVQTFYNPLPEEDVYTALYEIEGEYEYKVTSNGKTTNYTPAWPVYSYTYITVFADDTVIYYDQFENGYEEDISNPESLYSSGNKQGTQIWGDGDLSNGCAPGTTDDILRAGSVIKLESAVEKDKVGTELYYNGRDKWAATKPCAASRALWAGQSQTMLASANEMYDTSFFGKEFVAPVGENVEDAHELFEYTGFMIMAGENGATVQYSRGNDGRADGTVTLKEGETYFVDGDVEVGGWVKATQGDVQVELITGDIYDNYEVRFFKLLPKDMWSTSYTCPVTAPAEIVDGKTTYKCGNTIWIYNPNSTALTVTYSFRGNHYAMHEETLVVPAKSTLPLIAGKSIDGVDWAATERTDSGTYLTANAPFYAISTFDSIGTGASSLGKDKNGNPYSKGGDNKNWDWGFALVADNALSSQILVGLGLGCDPTSSKTSENGAPIWITAPYIGPEDAKKTGFNDSTKVYVKYDAATSEGKLTDDLGNPCDAVYTLHPLEVLKIYNESAKTAGSSEATNGQTGMTIWTTDGTRIAAAWGEDPGVATRSEPGIDMGTGIPPMPEILIHKDVELVKDADNDGHAMVGDTLEYTVTIYNAGRIGISEVYGSDLFDSSLSFVSGTFTFEGFDSDGNTTYRKRTLDDASFKAICDASTTSSVLLTSNLLKLGRTEPFLPAGGNWTFTYRTVIEDSQETIPNTAYAANKYTTVHSAVETPLRSKIGDYVWNDADKDGVQDEDEKPISGVKVTLKDTDGNVVLDDDGNQLVTTTDENGYYIFSGLVAGDYVVEFTTPSGFAPTTADAGSDDSVDSDIDSTGKTGTVTVEPGLANLDADAGFYLDLDASIKIVKTAGEAADGDVWTVRKGSAVKYTYVVTNTGTTYLKDVTVNDDKLGYVGKVSGILAPGKSATLTKTAEKIDDDVTNIGSVEGTPCNSKGTPYADVTVKDDDDAVVEVYELGSIGDYAWVDVDGDGVQESGEQGLVGVTVTLLDAEGKTVTTTTTDKDGFYLFSDLEPGTYSVVFDKVPDYDFTDKDVGDDAMDSDAGSNGKTDAITLASGENITTVDAGYVFNGDASIKIVKTAGDAADGDVYTTLKGSAVTYTYVVTNTGKTPLVNVTVTDDKLGAVGTVDGVLLPGKSATLTKTAAKVDEDVTNIGTVVGTPSDEDGTPVTDKTVDDDDDAIVEVYELGSIGDYAWVDVDGDGVQDEGEQGLPGVKVTLTDADGNVKTTTTDGNGKYLFKDLEPGTYTVSFEEPEGYKYSPANQGGDDARDSDASVVPTVVELASGEDDVTVDCGLVFNGDASIQIVKTAGEAADGETWTVQKGSAVTYTYVVTNTGKTPLVDVTVTDDKLGEVGTVDGVLLPGKSATLTKTAAKVDEDVTNIGTVEGTPSDEDGTPVSDEKVTDDDDAVVEVYELGSIGDTVWVDVDGDGIQDEGEQGLPGVTVTLTDEDGNVKTTTTDGNGKYLFEDLEPGTYTVSFEEPENYTYAPANQGGDDAKDSDASKTPVTIELTSGEDDVTVDCGLVFKGDASIKIVKTAGEAADGETWTVQKGSAVTYTYVVTNTGKTPLVDVTVTDDKLGAVGTVDGVLLPGKSATLTKTAAKVDEDVTNIGTVVGTPSDEDGMPVSDDKVTDDDDAVVEVYELGSIGDTVWVDVDGDGIQDEGEQGLEGVTVTLTDEDGNVKTTTTDENGKYLFEDLEPGKYEVSFEEPENYTYAPANQGGDDAKDSDASVVPTVVELTSGEDDVTVDCGLVYKGESSIQIVKTAGEAADGETWTVQKGSAVTYTYVVTNTGKTPLVDVTVTDDKLGEVGTVDGVLLPGKSATLTKTAEKVDEDVTNVGTVEGTPSDEDGTPVSDDKVTDDDDAVVEVYELGSIGDTVWVDVDGDGIQDEGEQGLPGVTVTLTDEDGNVKTTTTDENGKYLFDDLEPGKYEVSFEQPENYTYAPANQGGDDAKDSDATVVPTVVELTSGEDDVTVDCGLVFKGDASIKIVKTAGEAADGETWTVQKGSAVTYTYVVTNTGKTPLVDVTVTDDKLGEVGTVDGVLLPGESATLTKTADKVDEDVTNIGTVEGTPSDEDGTPVSDEKVTDDDDAVVEVYELGSIGDTVWVDVDGDGIQDEGEQGLPGVTVTLTDEDGNTKTTKTDENGKYLFDELEPGKYEVSFEEPENYTYAPANQGDDDAKDSDASKTPVTVELTSGEDDVTVDCGLVFAGDASIQIVKTAGEAADGETWTITKGAAVTYTYVVTNTGKTPLVDVTVTDDKLGEVGTVEGVLLPGKSATLTKTAAKVDEDVTNIGTVEGTPSDEDGTPVTDEKVTDDDDAVVEVKPGRIGDKVWNDTDLDGIQDENEMGVYGVTVELIDAETKEVIATTTTDAKGNYYFDDVEPGQYIVHFIPSTNWDIVDADQGDDDTVDSDADQDGYTQVIDFDGGEDLTIDCGLVGGVPPGICEWIDIAYYFNAVIGGNFTANGGDTEGDLLVVGDATLGAGYSVGSIGEGYGRARDAADTDHDTLVVGGNLTEAGTPDHNGNIVYGGDYNREGRTWGEGFTAREADPVTIDEEGNVPEDGTGVTLAEIVSDLTTFSEIASNLGETGNVVYDGNNWSGEAGYRNVFHVTDETFAINSLNSITITVPAGSKVLVNIYSESFTANMGSIRVVEAETGNEVDPSLVLFNFVNATEITTKNFEFPGSVLAPKAETSVLSGGSVNGFAFFNGDVTTSIGFEFHDFTFKAFDCSRSDVVTQRPVLDLVVTAEDDANGLIHRVDVGTEVRVNMVVTNPSDYDVKDVVLVDVLGNEIVIGDLAAGASQSFEANVTVNEDGLYTATVSGYGVGTKAYDGVLISDSDSVKFAVLKDAVGEAVAEEEVELVEEDKAVETEASSEDVAEAETSGESSMGGSTYVPRADFEIVSMEYVGPAPTVTNMDYKVRVVIGNSGEVAATLGTVAAWTDHPAVVQVGETPDAVQTANVSLAPGETYECVFALRSPAFADSACHVRVLADADNAVNELSELNNQSPLFYWALPILLRTSVEGDTLHLSWNSYEGQTYTVYVSTDLKNYEPLEGYIDIPATAPLNEVDIAMPEDAPAMFFKLVAEFADITD